MTKSQLSSINRDNPTFFALILKLKRSFLPPSTARNKLLLRRILCVSRVQRVLRENEMRFKQFLSLAKERQTHLARHPLRAHTES
ncbi:hypothetical protein B5X24_HaOG204268 [Helicoverpa armigera]|nr:hypothetical protein B5X24_HaOG204268 [Helicoverpa armigera]